MIESNQSNNSSKSSPTRTSASASASVTTTTSIPPVCCEFFIDTLNRLYKDVNLNNNDETNTYNKLSLNNKSDEIQDNLIVKPVLSPLDVISFLNYCHIWQQK
jgi:hypothetical protein